MRKDKNQASPVEASGTNPASLFSALEEIKPVISMLAGVKTHAMELGFSEGAAEELALEIFAKSGSSK